MSPRRTMQCGCKNSTKFKKRERLMRPTGKRRARMRAGAIGERGSRAMSTCGQEDLYGRDKEFCRDLDAGRASIGMFRRLMAVDGHKARI